METATALWQFALVVGLLTLTHRVTGTVVAAFGIRLALSD